MTTTEKQISEIKPSEEVAKRNARLSGYTGDICSNCGSVQMRRNGSCQVCEGCGTTTGCS
jgi:ribonucleoside-diphosphate reductase alpha chain